MNQLFKNAFKLFFVKISWVPPYDETPALGDRKKGQKCTKIFWKFNLIFPRRKANNRMK